MRSNIATDFIYDGRRLSYEGYRICQFNGVGDAISNGGEITLNEVPIQSGLKRVMAGYSYDTVIQTTFCICKDGCERKSDDEFFMTQLDVRDMARWLERKEFLPFMLLDDEHDEITYYGRFHIDQIRMGGRIVGLQLTFTSNSPFGWGNKFEKEYNLSAGGTVEIDDMSDEIGFQYLDMEIKCNQAGEMQIYNLLTPGELTSIKNCSSGEIIHIYHPIIETDKETHDIANDFNYVYPIITNTISESKNTYLFTLGCDVTIRYEPIAKMGV